MHLDAWGRSRRRDPSGRLRRRPAAPRLPLGPPPPRSHSTTSVAHTKEEGARGAGRRVGVKGEVVCRFDNGKGTNKGDVDVALGRWDVFG